MNYLRTAILLAGLTALFMGVGYLIGGSGGAVIALLVAAGMNFFAYWNADKLVLSMHGAHEVDERTAPELVRMVRELSQRAGLPMPRVYLMDNPQPNAFATGRNPQHAAVAATTGLLQMLSRDEIAGVIAHELAHIKNRDTLTMTITATIAGADLDAGAVRAVLRRPSRQQQRARHDRHHRDGDPRADRRHAGADGDQPHARIRRRRTGRADLRAARRHWPRRSPRSPTRRTQIDNPSAERNPATAHLFIINPLNGHGIDNLFSTHPSTENRIAALQQIAAGMGGGRRSAGSDRPAAARGQAAARARACRAASGETQSRADPGADPPAARRVISIAARASELAGDSGFMPTSRMTAPEPVQRPRRRRVSPPARSPPTCSKACCAGAGRSTSSSTTRAPAWPRSPIATARWCATWSAPRCAGSARCGICSACFSTAVFRPTRRGSKPRC